jgi:hypothetical protein
MEGERMSAQHRVVGLFNRVVFPSVTLLAGIIVLVWVFEKASSSSGAHRGDLVTPTVLGIVIVLGSVGLFVFANLMHRRTRLRDSEANDERESDGQ